MRMPFPAASCGILLLALLVPSRAAMAHRVNIVAWTEGGQVVAESTFSNGHKVRRGRVTVLDAVTGQKLAEGDADADGVFRFTPPEAARPHGLRLCIDAGEGHRNEWVVAPEELGGPLGPAPAAAGGGTAAGAPALAEQASLSDAAGLRAAIEAALEAKLGPVRRDLAALRVRGPGLAEIVGGMGWLVGLAGLALYFKGRRG